MSIQLKFVFRQRQYQQVHVYIRAKTIILVIHLIDLKAGFTEAFLGCETGKSPYRSHLAARATAATGPSQKLSSAQVELGSTFAMRQAIWRTILTFSIAKLYKGSRVEAGKLPPLEDLLRPLGVEDRPRPGMIRQITLKKRREKHAAMQRKFATVQQQCNNKKNTVFRPACTFMFMLQLRTVQPVRTALPAQSVNSGLCTRVSKRTAFYCLLRCSHPTRNEA